MKKAMLNRNIEHIRAPLIKTEERAVIQVGYILVRLIIDGFGPGSKQEIVGFNLTLGQGFLAGTVGYPPGRKLFLREQYPQL
jgi:hypothetical protein